MKWFGRKSAGRALPRPALLRSLVAAGFGEWPRSYEAQVREGYLENAIAQRAVRLVADGVASAPLTSSDAVALALVRATSGGQGLLETVAVHLLLHGNAYIEMLPGQDGRPGELYALRPERVSVEADARGWPVAFVYRVGAQATRMPAASIIHIRSIHPLDDHYGLGCLGAASGAVAIHNAAAKWNKALLDNAARPSGALVTDGGEALSAEQFDRLQEELASSFAGSANAGRPMILEGGLKWQSLSLSPADMDFLGLKAAAAREIALAFGVPPMLLGLPGDATYANYREANRALWRQAILPLAAKVLDALAQGLRPWFADLALSVDLDQVSALSEDRERLWAQVGAAGFLTVDEKRELVGFEGVAPNSDEVETEGAEASTEPADGDGEKFNQWHDPANGQFTFSGQGVQFGDGGSGAGGVAGGGTSFRPTPSRVTRSVTVIGKPSVSGRQAGPPIVNKPMATFDQLDTITIESTSAQPIRTSNGRTIVNRATATYQAPGLNGKGYEPEDGDKEVLARITYAESLSIPGDFAAIAWTTVNRVGERQHGLSLKDVVYKPGRYEPLNGSGSVLWNGSANPSTLKGDQLVGWNNAAAIADGVLSGSIPDPTGGATYFFASRDDIRGQPETAPNRFFQTNLKNERLLDSDYLSAKVNGTRNHFFIEVPVQPAISQNRKTTKK